MPKGISSNSKAMTLVARSDSTSFSSVASEAAAQEDSSTELQDSGSQMGAAADEAQVGHQAAPTGLCPVVGFSSFMGQLSFKAILHLAVFGGESTTNSRDAQQVRVWDNTGTCAGLGFFQLHCQRLAVHALAVAHATVVHSASDGF